MNILYTFEKQLRPLSSRIVSKDLAVQSRVVDELRFWQGKKETSSGVHSRLKRYWDGIGVASWSATGTPWSAAFISYVLQGPEIAFPGSAAHYIYTQNAMQGKGGWRAISIPKNKGKIQVAIGDVFVKPRSGSNTNTHGDVVYKIKGNTAYLAGGNVSNTAKGTMSLSLDKNRTLMDGGKYLIVLKKNPKYETGITANKVLAYGGFTVASLLTGALVYLVGKRKGYWAEGSASHHLRLLPDLSKREIIEKVVFDNWPQQIVGVEYQANYKSPLDGVFLPQETMEVTEYQAIPDPIISTRPFDLDKAFPKVQQQSKQALFFEFDNTDFHLKTRTFENQFAADNKIRADLYKQGILVKATSWVAPASSGYPMTLYRVEW